MVAIPIILLIIAIVYLILICSRRFKKVHEGVMKLKKALIFGTIIRVFSTSYLPFAITSGIGRNLSLGPDK